MVSHHITLTIKSTAGTLPNVEFNISNNVKKILDEALKELPLDKSPQTPQCRMTGAPPQRYYRMQVNLKGYGSDDLDDASGTNIAALERHAGELIERESTNLDAIAQALSG